nr:putative glycoprotein [Takachi virus]BCU46458.1 putative glycoprotein [Takachi virus]BCU46470.1 putative glycoprotein [Takachi virus]BCU46476.1 putative glycoprotein [Takachi virus]
MAGVQRVKKRHQTIHEFFTDYTPIPQHWYDWLTGWFGHLTDGVERIFRVFSWMVEFVTKNVITIVAVIVMATPLAAAIPPAVRLLIISIVFATTGAKAQEQFEDDHVLKMPVEMLIHLILGVFQGRDIVNPVSLVVVALSNLLPLPIPLLLVPLAHVLLINRDWASAISGAVAYRGGLVGVVLYHLANSSRLRGVSRRLVVQAEGEAIEQLPESHPWFDPPIRSLIEDLSTLRLHSVDYVTATLQGFLRASLEKRARKYRRVAHVRKGDIRSLKNFYLYPAEYHRIMPHLQAMAPSQIKLLKQNMPTILTRREGDYGPILQAFKKAGYAGDLATRN